MTAATATDSPFATALARTSTNPPLQVGMLVEAIAGDHAGVAGEIWSIVIETGGVYVILKTQMDTFVRVEREDVEPL